MSFCNTLFCNPDIKGMTKAELIEEYGDPNFIETRDANEILTYEVAPLWRYGAKAKLVAVLENGIVSDSTFVPVQDKESQL
jgi:hypothetical protein